MCGLRQGGSKERGKAPVSESSAPLAREQEGRGLAWVVRGQRERMGKPPSGGEVGHAPVRLHTPPSRVVPTIHRIPILHTRDPKSGQVELRELTLCGNKPTQTVQVKS